MDFRQLIGDQSASDQQTQQPATTGVNFNALVKKVSPEVSTEPTPSLDVSKYIDKDKLDFAQTVSPLIGMSKYTSYSQSENVAKSYFGHPEKPASAAQKIKNYVKNTSLDQQINRINGMYPMGPLPPEAQTQVDELEAQKEGQTLEGVPKFVADTISGFGTFAGETATKAGAAAGALSEDFQGLVAKGFQILGVQ